MPQPDRPKTSDAPLPQAGVEGSPLPEEPGGRAFAWGVWGMMTLAAFGFVGRYGTEVPAWDDSNVVPAMVGARPVTPGWLWEQANEHRIPLPKLVFVTVGRAVGGDIRVGMFLSVASMSVLAASMVALADRLRDGPRASDAFFPILLLHPGHSTNFLWGFQFTPLLPTAIATAFLIPIAGRPAWPGPASAAMAGIGLALLPLCGGNGLVFVPPLALWLLAGAASEVRSGRLGSGRRGAAIALSTVPGLALTVAYFRGFRPVPHPESPGGALDGVRAAVQFLAGGLGFPAAWAWPWSGVATIALLGLVVAWAAWGWVTRPGERPRLVGLAAFLAGVVALAGAVGWGRGWSGDRAGFAERYVAMATPFWCWLAIALRIYAPSTLGRVVANALFALACVLAWPNAEAGLRHGRENVGKAEALALDIREGMPPYRIVRKHTPYLHPSHDVTTWLLPIFREAGVGPFEALVDDPPFRITRLPLTPVELRLVRWEGTTAHVTDVDPQVTFALPAPRYVAGIRIRYSHANRQGAPARFQATWKAPGQGGYADDRRYADWTLPTGDDRETTIWVDGVLDRFRIQPDNQICDFRFQEIVLLEPVR